MSMDKDELEKNFHLLNSDPARIAVGNNRNWWTVADKMEFNTRQQKLVNANSTSKRKFIQDRSL